MNVESYNYGTLPSQFPIRSMEHESTAKTNSMLVTEILGSWRISVIGVVRPTLKGTKNLNENGPNPFFNYFGTKNMVRVNLMATVLFWHGFDN